MKHQYFKGSTVEKEPEEQAEEQQPQEEAENFTCRICLEDNCQRKELIAPCACKGSSKWVHRACLDRWRSIREDKAFSRCTECLQYYELLCLTNDTCQQKCLRRSRFSAYVCRDFSFFFFVTQCFVLFFSFFTYLCDIQSHYLLHSFQMEQYPWLFYYLFGIFLSFSVIGIIGTCIRSQICGDFENMNCYCNDFWLFPYMTSADFGGGSSAVAGGGGSGGEVCCCCPQNCAFSCAECGSCNTCECGTCLAGAGEELIYLFIFVIVVFAIIGIFVFIFVGVMVVQQIIRKHFHILDKWNLTKEYVVKDLAPGAIPVWIPSASSPSSSDQRYDLEANNYHSSIEIPSYSTPLYHSSRENNTVVSPMVMIRDQDEVDHLDLIHFNESNHPLPDPTAPPMESLDPHQRNELIRLGLL